MTNRFSKGYRVWQFILVLLVLWTIIQPEQWVSAHPADMYAQDQSILFTEAGFQITWEITPGPLLAYTLWQQADQDLDRKISSTEAAMWGKTMLSHWEISIDSRPMAGLVPSQVIWPEDLSEMQASGQPIQILFEGSWPGAKTDRLHLDIHNTFEETISLNWFSVSSATGLTFQLPRQDNGALSLELFFPSASQTGAGSAQTALTSWESGRPNLTGLSGAVTNFAASLANPSSDGQPGTPIAQVTEALTGLVRSDNFSPGFFMGAFLLSMVLGSLHALTPGHGKTLVAAYLVGSHGKTADAVFLGTVVTLTHTGSVLLLGLISLVASRYILPSIFMPILETISGLLVIGFGIHLLLKRTGELRENRLAERKKKTIFSMKNRYKPVSVNLVQGSRGSPTLHMQSNTGEHTHSHLGGHVHEHSHTHTHGLPGQKVTLKSLLTLGISGGLVPCPDAIAILLVAVAINRILFGMALIIAFSLGLALVLITIGIAMVHGSHMVGKTRLANPFSAYIPAVSALVVLVLGTSLTVTAVQGLLSSAASSKAQTVIPLASTQFDLDQASLIYLAPDTDQHYQLFRRPLSGGQPIQLSRVPDGISKFVLSPDQQMILYSLFNPNGSSAIHLIETDGSRDTVLLDCPNFTCIDPVWSPNQDAIFYERRTASAGTLLPIYSIWSISLQSRETQPVFQDQRFPAYTPRFSYDGQWMSYTSPSTNSIRIYNLVDGRSLTLDLPSSAPVEWSPVAYQFLLWETQLKGSQYHRDLKVFDVNKGQMTDLFQNDHYEDYQAAWSPDGQWVAINRGDASSMDSSIEEKIWLVKSDGSQAHVWIDHPGTSYGELSWSPDGRYLLFSCQGNNTQEAEIWLKDLRTGEETSVATGGSQYRLIH